MSIANVSVGLGRPDTCYPTAELYERAKVALRECANLDELKDISDKTIALEAYAKQARDGSLLDYAKRVQVRAFVRIGQLLREIENDDERRALIKRAGITPVIARRACEAAHIPTRVRERILEARVPPTRQRMSNVGRGYMRGTEKTGFRRHAKKESDQRMTAAQQSESLADLLKCICDDLERTRTDGFRPSYSMAALAKEIAPRDADRLRGYAVRIMADVGEFKMNLPKFVRTVR